MLRKFGQTLPSPSQATKLIAPIERLGLRFPCSDLAQGQAEHPKPMRIIFSDLAELVGWVSEEQADANMLNGGSLADGKLNVLERTVHRRDGRTEV